MHAPDLKVVATIDLDGVVGGAPPPPMSDAEHYGEGCRYAGEYHNNVLARRGGYSAKYDSLTPRGPVDPDAMGEMCQRDFQSGVRKGGLIGQISGF